MSTQPITIKVIDMDYEEERLNEYLDQLAREQDWQARAYACELSEQGYSVEEIIEQVEAGRSWVDGIGDRAQE